MSQAQLSREEALETIDRLERRFSEFGNVLATYRDRIEDLEAENDALRERVAELEGKVDPNPLGKEYDEKTRDELVRELRIELARKANRLGGAAGMNYRDVLTVFHHHPSDGYAYKLMKLAAGYEEPGEDDEWEPRSTFDGYRYTRKDGERRLQCNLEDVNDESVLHAVKGTDRKEGVE